MSDFDETTLIDALGQAQSLGFLGDRPIPEAVAHAREVVRAIDDVEGEVVDLGSGGGVPGLVIAHDRPDLRLELVDRRAKRTDFLERMVRRLGLTSRVTVTSSDAELLVRACSSGARAGADAVVARGFGPPSTTIRIMRDLVRPGGRLVITEPPDGDRWDAELLQGLDVVRLAGAWSRSVAVFERSAAGT